MSKYRMGPVFRDTDRNVATAVIETTRLVLSQLKKLT